MSKYLGYLAFVFILLFLTYILKSVGFVGGKLVSAVGTVGMMMAVALGLGEVFSVVSDSVLVSGISDVVSVALKMLGVGYIFGIAADICRDLGENGIATACLTLGRVEILLLALPYLKHVIELAIGLLKV